MDVVTLTRPAEFVETRLINAILDGSYPIDTCLPGERDLADRLGVTRPTLREALQRLARDGWIEIRHGKPTRVRDFWREGNLGVLEAVSNRRWAAPPGFVSQLLEVRLALAPAYTRLAVEKHPEAVASLAAIGLELPLKASSPDQEAESAEAFAQFDWNLHHKLTILCGNPIYTLILNGFTGMYVSMARIYFRQYSSRRASETFYSALAATANSRDHTAAEIVTQQAMLTSLALWNTYTCSEEEG